MSELTVTKDNFKEEVLDSDLPVIVDFWAEWCVPCKMIHPILDEVSQEYDGKLKVAKVDVDQEGDLASDYNVISIPTLLLFKDGIVVNQHVGAGSKESIQNFFSDYV